ncbi:MAG: putative membrane protein YdjX (TVP38/TMEM64 family) [Myxococcota bacterium]|jgi:uncharacterized membrane protein YdjX (TVP38/TMEM64 family)
MIVVVRVFPVLDLAVDIMAGMRDLGPIGWVAYSIMFGILTSAFVPGSVLTMLAGATWGLGVGTLIVAPGCALASVLSAALGRTLLRDVAVQTAARFPILDALDRVIGQDAFRVVTLLRLSPIMPFAVSNYGLGTTSAPLWAIGAGTLIGIVPVTALWVYFGTLAGEAVTSGFVPESGYRTAMLVGGLVITFAIVGWIGRRAKRLLDAEAGSA